MKKANLEMLGRIAATLLIISLLFVYRPAPAFSQQEDAGSTIQNLVINGGFEGGFQEEYGVGYGWGGFSNGNAVVGWNYDDWDAVVPNDQYAQRIEIKDAIDPDRYAGIYQTIQVIPGQQYKLTIKGLIRSEEGTVEVSDYGYRLQYAIDYNGDTAWELVEEDAWQELPWDEQPLTLANGQSYGLDTFNTTITATTDELTLFIRGWKKWINNGDGVFNLDTISVVGPAPEGFQAPVLPSASVENGPSAADAFVVSTKEADEVEVLPLASEPAASQEEDSPVVSAQTDDSMTVGALAQKQSASSTSVTPLPATGQGDDAPVMYVMVIGLAVLVALFGSAITATLRRRTLAE